MTRGELERLATPLIDRTFEVCKEALGIARLSQTDFQQLLLVGGSTRVPLVKRRVEDFWKRDVRAHISPDEVVAIGAAIQASALSGAERRKGTVPPPPHPARSTMPSSTDRPSVLAARRKGGTLPPGVQRQRSDTAPGPAMLSGPRARAWTLRPTRSAFRARSRFKAAARACPPRLACKKAPIRWRRRATRRWACWVALAKGRSRPPNASNKRPAPGLGRRAARDQRAHAAERFRRSAEREKQPPNPACRW